MASSDVARDDLITIRDWLRYAVSRFTAARLAYGHGASTALDEAAYLILSALDLPIDQLEPWLDARLTGDERTRIADLIDQRISTRKPAPYLLRKAWIGPYSFHVDERVIVPRSYIGELLRDGLTSVIADGGPGPARILDLCTGSGCLAIIAALTFPDAHVDASDLSRDALDVATGNVADYGLDARISLIQSDLFAALGDARYDLIIANPPYVATAEMAAFPPEYRHEPAMAHAGGPDGLDLVRRILKAAPNHLAPAGHVVVEIGTGRGLLEAEFPSLPFLWLDTEVSEGEVFALPATAFAARRPRPAPKAATKRQ